MKIGDSMTNKERKIAKRIDCPNRTRHFTEMVYSGEKDNSEEFKAEVFGSIKSFYPEPSKYNIYFGEMHGHTELSDGRITLDDYFLNIRDNAKLDFAAITDHDHGGVGKPELWNGAWDEIKAKVKEYYKPGKFTTILGYERDSYPWYDNLVIYYNDHDGQLIRGEMDGEITRKELLQVFKRDDIIAVPHDTYCINAGADFKIMPEEMFSNMIEIYSRGDSAEYFGNPYNIADSQFEGGFWQDALKRGAKMGCIGGSDDHDRYHGLNAKSRFEGDLEVYPGITGVLAEENTLESIFSAIKARRTFAFMGGRVEMDFRINNHYMGEEFVCDGERSIYLKVLADAPIKKITVVKNCRDYVTTTKNELFFFDNSIETDCDYYYLRVELEGERCGWTSPIWVNRQSND